MAVKGVIVEYDFAAMDGAKLLYRTTKEFLNNLDGIALDENAEAKHLAGKTYQSALTELFSTVKTRKTAAKAAKDLAAAFVRALDAEVAKSVSPAFRNFVKTLLAGEGVRVVIATRADVAAVASTFAPLLSEDVRLYHEESLGYGSVKGEGWRRACVANGLRAEASVAVTGSGFGVKSALIAGIESVAVSNAHVAYQDFTGASEVVDELNAATARKIIKLLKIR